MAESLLPQKDGLSQCLSLLQRDEYESPSTEENLPQDPDFTRRHDLNGGRYSESCGLDNIHEPPIDGEETFYFPEEVPDPDAPYYIVDTRPGPGKPERGWENGRKGHKVRIMGVWKDHGVLPPVDETGYMGKNLAERVRDTAAKQIGDGYEITYIGLGSKENHMHVVASDLQTRKEADSDLPGIGNWIRYRVEDGEPTELEDFNFNGPLGAYLGESLL